MTIDPFSAFLAAVIALAAAALVIGSTEENTMHTEVTKALELLGLKVRDRVTGLTGVASSICFDLYGCVQAIVTPPVDEKGALPESKWIDVSRLEVLDASPVMEIPGGRFVVARSSKPAASTSHPGPAEKPARQ
jgi:hypothetical protein